VPSGLLLGGAPYDLKDEGTSSKFHAQMLVYVYRSVPCHLLTSTYIASITCVFNKCLELTPRCPLPDISWTGTGSSYKYESF